MNEMAKDAAKFAKDSFERASAQRELMRLSRGETTPLVTPEPVEREILDDDAAKQLISMTFVSRTEGRQVPHIVTKHFGGTLACTCQANPEHGCWATKAFKRVAGIQ